MTFVPESLSPDPKPCWCFRSFDSLKAAPTVAGITIPIGLLNFILVILQISYNQRIDLLTFNGPKTAVALLLFISVTASLLVFVGVGTRKYWLLIPYLSVMALSWCFSMWFFFHVLDDIIQFRPGRQMKMLTSYGQPYALARQLTALMMCLINAMISSVFYSYVYDAAQELWCIRNDETEKKHTVLHTDYRDKSQKTILLFIPNSVSKFVVERARQRKYRPLIPIATFIILSMIFTEYSFYIILAILSKMPLLEPDLLDTAARLFIVFTICLTDIVLFTWFYIIYILVYSTWRHVKKEEEEERQALRMENAGKRMVAQYLDLITKKANQTKQRLTDEVVLTIEN